MSELKRAPKTRAFLAAIREMPNIRAAALAAGVTPWIHYRRLKRDPRYAAAFEAAWKVGAHRLEDEATVRAIEGWEEPVYQGGGLVGTKRKFSDRCLLARLQAEFPEKYGRKVEVAGPGGGPIESTLKVVFVSPEDGSGSEVPEETPVPV